MPKIRNATRAAAVAFAEKVALKEGTGVNIYAAPGEGPGVWYVRPLDLPAPPCCEQVAQILFGPSDPRSEERYPS
jgi:hypothetical protein